ncbi:unnamed protein product [Sphenostylis stenocarpa]|uniref:Uncharacterized protein n=1 Tax=Sphenostylis stenocarpa TaxID=92480 RepID=A0AA86W2R9_9FABA|nr:unnamed protein product [Sphenostylis stenocarpa]
MQESSTQAGKEIEERIGQGWVTGAIKDMITQAGKDIEERIGQELVPGTIKDMVTQAGKEIEERIGPNHRLVVPVRLRDKRDSKRAIKDMENIEEQRLRRAIKDMEKDIEEHVSKLMDDRYMEFTNSLRGIMQKFVSEEVKDMKEQIMQESSTQAGKEIEERIG